MLQQIDLEKLLLNLLSPEKFDDYCPNGLQIQGQEKIKKIVFAVSATRESIEYTVKQKAQALIVHHGLFWKFHGTRTITGPFADRIIPLIKNNINLFAFHLPLDAHLKLGNAAQIALKLKLKKLAPFGNYKGSPIGVSGEFNSFIQAEDLKNTLEKILQHPVIFSNPKKQKGIKSIGIITGGANGEWKQAQIGGLDSYLTGEMSEHDWHESQESGIAMFAGGHNATEQFGVQALMEYVSKKFDVKCTYFHSANPA